MAYNQMASLYDHLMSNVPYEAWVYFTEHIIKASAANPLTILDLGCGTGEITIQLAKKGYHLTGIDYSSDMLTYAEAKSHNEKLNIDWINQDIRKLEGFKNYDMAISYCDVINYVTSEEDLRESFERVAISLKDKGLFIFDVHSLNHVKNDLVEHTFTETSEEVSYIWDCYQGDAPGEMFHDLIFFVEDGNGKYDRFEEYHHQKTYSTEFYSKLLIESGFEKPILYSNFSIENAELPKDTDRIFFVTKKRSR